MLLLPSEILRNARVKTVREYAIMIRKYIIGTLDIDKVSKKDNYKIYAQSLGIKSFLDPRDGHLCYESTYKELEKEFDDDEKNTKKEEKDFVLLPPLFIRSNDECIIKLHKNLYLVCCHNGPIIPAVLSINFELLNGHDTLLDDLIGIYNAKSKDHVNQSNLYEVLKEAKLWCCP